MAGTNNFLGTVNKTTLQLCFPNVRGKQQHLLATYEKLVYCSRGEQFFPTKLTLRFRNPLFPKVYRKSRREATFFQKPSLHIASM